MERFVPGERITLRADMKLPGSAWLDFRVRGAGQGCEIEQTVVFACRGLVGELYWRIVQPIHAMVFDGMLLKMAEAALEDQTMRGRFQDLSESRVEAA